MLYHTRSVVVAALAASAGLFSITDARADISGFGDFSQFRINQNDSATAPALFPATDTIELTTAGSAQLRSIFCTTRQSIAQFTASFRFEALNAEQADGISFIVQNDPRGASAVSPGPGFGGFGYAGISQSVGVTLELGGSNASASGLYTNGNLGGSSPSTAPLSFYSGHWIDVSLVYNGSTLHETLTDAVAGTSFDRLYPLDLPSLVGGATAYIGFGASGFNNGSSDLYIGDPQFAVPAPAGASTICIAGLFIARRRRRCARR